MEKWLGAAGICLNDKNELLMVLEGRLEGAGKWSVPTGGIVDKETFEECAVREVREETGYKVEVVEKLKVKSGVYEDIQIAYEVHYFSMKIIGGKAQGEIRSLDLNYPEDREYLLARF